MATQQTKQASPNVDPAEVAKFDAMAARWWDPDGDFKPLHQLNPVRFGFVADRVALNGARVVDVGCGGGILSESLARAGATVTGIDLAGEALSVARLHATASNVDINYRELPSSALANEEPGTFDAVTCMELLEHVPDPQALIDDCVTLLKPGGKAFFSTINRTAKAYALAIVAAEYVMRLVPRGTHEYDKFLKPSELAAMLRNSGFVVDEVAGLRYDPLGGMHSLTKNPDVNYVIAAHKPESRA
ncbi:MAG: bifunctional 2-polyprenyl-6-hydroxyphenol methylase/3-demethylubiquinol 3-O-methyltransferase UbiG [Pseudomonadota bacterium]